MDPVTVCTASQSSITCTCSCSLAGVTCTANRCRNMLTAKCTMLHHVCSRLGRCAARFRSLTAGCARLGRPQWVGLVGHKQSGSPSANPSPSHRSSLPPASNGFAGRPLSRGGGKSLGSSRQGEPVQITQRGALNTSRRLCSRCGASSPIRAMCGPAELHSS